MLACDCGGLNSFLRARFFNRFFCFCCSPAAGRLCCAAPPHHTHSSVKTAVYNQKASQRFREARNAYISGALLSPTLTLVCALSLDSFANISGDIGQGNSTTFVAFQTAEEGSSISALQLALESFILGLVVLVFFFVGGRCERERALRMGCSCSVAEKHLHSSQCVPIFSAGSL